MQKLWATFVQLFKRMWLYAIVQRREVKLSTECLKIITGYVLHSFSISSNKSHLQFPYFKNNLAKKLFEILLATSVILNKILAID